VKLNKLVKPANHYLLDHQIIKQIMLKENNQLYLLALTKQNKSSLLLIVHLVSLNLIVVIK